MTIGAASSYRIIALLMVGAGFLRAQGDGQAEIAFQGYYLGGGVQSLSDITGIAASFRTFFPGLGLISGSAENYGSDGRFRTGNNYLDLNGASWMGLHWRFTGGDFHVPTALLPLPFSNIVLPELGAEGVKIEAWDANRRYTLLYGMETLVAGPRVPFRFRVPQNVFAASVVQKVGQKLDLGVRILNLSTGADTSGEMIFAPGQDFRTATTISADLSYHASANLQVYAEASAAATAGGSLVPLPHQQPGSFTFGPVWNSRKVTVKANYIYQPPSYLPIAGYFLGDRSGPFVEARFKASEGTEFFGSASTYRDNLENSPDLPTFRSTSTSAGVSVGLPFRFSAGAQISAIDFSVKQPTEDAFSKSHNQQLVATLGRPVRNHNLHVSYRDLELRSEEAPQRQRSVEIEDIVQFKRFSLGGAVRDQRLIADQSHDTLFVRGSAQVQFRRFSAYAYVEHGNDLANQTVFLTSTFSTTVFGGALRINKAWNLQIEASQNRLTTDLNPENVFLLQNQGSFVTSAISGLNQWTAYFRLRRSIRWGRGLPEGDLDRYTAEQIPIVGTIHGTVTEEGAAVSAPAEGIPVVLDDGRTAVTDRSGMFQFAGVPEGRHHVAIATNQLPADYDPGAAPGATVDVKPRRTADLGLTVVPLVALSGTITGPAGTSLDGIILKLLPTDRYTTPDTDGHFAFYNLREGEYELTIDLTSLPEFAVLDRSTTHISLKRGVRPEEAAFHLEIKVPEKPIRRNAVASDLDHIY
ncbi:MAG TPA: carboxypeptidase-like regulatory domain-containing protein [Bryobacteraceae bacterium]|nr:carboxypeptidase-like regulatory domain-containing protein [Bryobacteraceae bacterium]